MIRKKSIVMQGKLDFLLEVCLLILKFNMRKYYVSDPQLNYCKSEQCYIIIVPHCYLGDRISGSDD